jgi:peroxiredoxin
VVVATARRLSQQWLAAGVLVASVVAWSGCGTDEVAPTPCAANSDPAAEKAHLGFVLKDMAGEDVRLSDFKGRPLLVNFWATWCGPCKVEIPIFNDLAEKYRSRNFAVLGISIDDSPEELKEFTGRYKVGYPLLVGSGQDALLEAYDAGVVVPVSWLIRCDGTVAVKKKGTASREWFETQVKALF